MVSDSFLLPVVSLLRVKTLSYAVPCSEVDAGSCGTTSILTFNSSVVSRVGQVDGGYCGRPPSMSNIFCGQEACGSWSLLRPIILQNWWNDHLLFSMLSRARHPCPFWNGEVRGTLKEFSYLVYLGPSCGLRLFPSTCSVSASG